MPKIQTSFIRNLFTGKTIGTIIHKPDDFGWLNVRNKGIYVLCCIENKKENGGNA